MERRSTSRSVDDLRRELRKADEERFHLEAALTDAATDWLQTCATPTPAPARRSRHVAKVSALCTVAGLFLAGVLVWPQLRRPDVSAAASPNIHAIPNIQPVPPLPAADPGVAPHPALVSVPVSAPHAPSRLHATKVRHRNQTNRTVHIRRAPRPLSPAEFGRRAVMPAS
jgi:hypothetical protein